MTVYDDMDDLIKDYVTSNIFFTEEELEQVKNCTMVVEDMLPSGTYDILDDGKIVVY